MHRASEVDNPITEQPIDEPTVQIGALSEADLSPQYTPDTAYDEDGKAKHDYRHLRLGLTAKGLLLLLEHIKFIYANSDVASREYTAAAAVRRPGTHTQWKYSESYQRTSELQWLNEEVGQVKPHNMFGLKNVVGYDIVEYIKCWLKEYNTNENNFKYLSMCEVILVDPQFEEIRPCVGIANIFVSHMQSEPLLGNPIHTFEMGTNNRMPIKTFESTMHLLWANGTFNKSLSLASSYLWMDYTSLRQCQKDFKPKIVVQLIKEIGTVLCLMDSELRIMQRSFCVLELFAATEDEQTKLVCQTNQGIRSRVEHKLAENPVRSKKAKAHNEEDTMRVLQFFEKSPGGCKQVDEAVTKAMVQSAANYAGNSCELCCLGQCVRLFLPWSFCLDCKKPMYRAAGPECVMAIRICFCCCTTCW
jgi:hypothetical protein